MSWRDRARPIIAQVLLDTDGMDEKVIDKAIFNAYPFGMRRYHPYKIWLSEVRNQRYGKPLRTPDPRQIHLPLPENDPQITIAEVYGTMEIR